MTAAAQTAACGHTCQGVTRRVYTLHVDPLQPTATHCNPLQPTATHCNPLQPAATHCMSTHCTRQERKRLRAEKDFKRLVKKYIDRGKLVPTASFSDAEAVCGERSAWYCYMRIYLYLYLKMCVANDAPGVF